MNANRWTDSYWTYHDRPKAAAEVGTWSERELACEGAAIVMQGPILARDDFTIETLKLYKRDYPSAHLIYSSWKDTEPAAVAALEALGVELVLSDKPAVPGLYNINMQLVSSANGVRRAVERGAEWVLKTRSDQRFYAAGFLSHLIGLAKTFPVVSGFRQRHRIIGAAHGTLKYAPYHATDQTVFGHAEDMQRYWGAPLREEPPPAHWPPTIAEIHPGIPVGELCRHGAAESYLASQFLLAVGRELKWTLEDSWAAFRDHFGFVDYSANDFYWGKVQVNTLREIVAEYAWVSNRQELGFRDWMLLYSGQLPCEAARRYEHALSTRFIAPVSSAG